jgi:hypothetical protein
MSIPFKSISRLLPFPTQIVAGFTYNHLRSMYAYDIKTPTRVISEKDTLCGRESSKFFFDAKLPVCPGCSAIGENIALQNPNTTRDDLPAITLQSTQTRNRHTPENDIKTALIKRINRKMQQNGGGNPWKVKVSKNGTPFIIDTVTGLTVIEKLVLPLDELAAVWGVQNATACVKVTEPVPLFKAPSWYRVGLRFIPEKIASTSFGSNCTKLCLPKFRSPRRTK